MAGFEKPFIACVLSVSHYENRVRTIWHIPS